MKIISRRELLKIIGFTGIASSIIIDKSYSENSKMKQLPECVLTPEQTAGPFYFNVEQVREDITENKEGLPLILKLNVVNARNCKPIKDAIVDIWHTDAMGVYSGYKNQGVDTRGEKFLRGVQVTNFDGSVKFKTIYPGYYPGRVPHIHFKVYLDNQSLVTSQFYFPTKITEDVYKNHIPYKNRKVNYINESDDIVVRWYGGLESLRLKLNKSKDGYIANHTIGIKT